MEDAASTGERHAARAPTPEEQARTQKRNTLLLSRTRVAGELQRCSNLRFRAQLECELKYLDSEIAKLAE